MTRSQSSQLTQGPRIRLRSAPQARKSIVPLTYLAVTCLTATLPAYFLRVISPRSRSMRGCHNLNGLLAIIVLWTSYIDGGSGAGIHGVANLTRLHK